MKKFLTLGMIAAMSAGIASAQEEVVMVGQAPASSEAEASVEAALVSSYVWRGQVLNNDMVFQPQFTIAQYGVSFNVWANYDLGENYIGIQGDFSELDLSLAYTLPLDLNDFSFDIGVISYQFPANGDIPGTSAGVNSKSTTEIFAAAHWLTFKDYVIPSATFFGDVKEANGVYILFDVVAPYQISEFLYVEGGISTGWGNTSYNDYYWSAPSNGGNVDEGFNDYNFYGNVSYMLLDNLTATFNLTYTGTYGGAIRNAAKENYEAAEKLWAGLNVAYDF